MENSNNKIYEKIEKDKINKAKAKKIIAFNKKGMAHTFYNAPWGLIGGDHSKKSLFKDIDNAIECKITGEQALGMGHGLSIIPTYPCKQSDIIFVETKGNFNKKEITKLTKQIQGGKR